ncbi:MAG: hypothetical protein ACK53Y_18870, partial [bacterium]
MGHGLNSHPVNQYVVLVCGRMAENCFLSTRLGGHHWQMEKWSYICQLARYVYSHPMPMGWGSG